jgi:hypothetical protein
MLYRLLPGGAFRGLREPLADGSRHLDDIVQASRLTGIGALGGQRGNNRFGGDIATRSSPANGQP